MLSHRMEGEATTVAVVMEDQSGDKVGEGDEVDEGGEVGEGDEVSVVGKVGEGDEVGEGGRGRGRRGFRLPGSLREFVKGP